MKWKPENRTLLQLALESLGYRVSEAAGQVVFDKPGFVGRFLADGQLSVTFRDKRSTFDVNQLKRAYSTQVVKSAAQKFGWNLTAKDETNFVMQKRGL